MNNPAVIFGLADLLAVFADDPLARSWIDGEFIGRLINELNPYMSKLINSASTDETEENKKQIEKLSSLLHLFCLVWKNFPNQGIHIRLQNRIPDENTTMD